MNETDPVPGSPSPDAHPGLPRWVKVSAAVVVILVLALLLAMLVGGGDHGPGRHAAGLG